MGCHGDLFAELAMLHRRDCPADFFRASQFYPVVLASPNLPVEVAQKLLFDAPSGQEVELLAICPDSPISQRLL